MTTTRGPLGIDARPFAVLARRRRAAPHLERAADPEGRAQPDEAREALSHGVDGLIVSNHGGRQLDGARLGDRGAAGDRRGGRRPHPGPPRRRRAARRGCGEGAGARRARLPDRAAAALGACGRRRSRRRARAGDLPKRDRPGDGALRRQPDRRYRAGSASPADARLTRSVSRPRGSAGLQDIASTKSGLFSPAFTFASSAGFELREPSQVLERLVDARARHDHDAVLVADDDVAGIDRDAADDDRQADRSRAGLRAASSA